MKNLLSVVLLLAISFNVNGQKYGCQMVPSFYEKIGDGILDIGEDCKIVYTIKGYDGPHLPGIRELVKESLQKYKANIEQFNGVLFVDGTGVDSLWNKHDLEINPADNFGELAAVPPILFEPGVLGYAWPPYVNIPDITGVLYINIREYLVQAKEYQLKTMVHELGHTWGMGHVEDRDNFMYRALIEPSIKWVQDIKDFFTTFYSGVNCTGVVHTENTESEPPVENDNCSEPINDYEYALSDYPSTYSNYLAWASTNGRDVLSYLDYVGVSLFTYKAQRTSVLSFRCKVYNHGQYIYRTEKFASRADCIVDAIHGSISAAHANGSMSYMNLETKRLPFLLMFVFVLLALLAGYYYGKFMYKD